MRQLEAFNAGEVGPLQRFPPNNGFALRFPFEKFTAARLAGEDGH